MYSSTSAEVSGSGVVPFAEGLAHDGTPAGHSSARYREQLLKQLKSRRTVPGKPPGVREDGTSPARPPRRERNTMAI